jgi:hypothetical protein
MRYLKIFEEFQTREERALSDILIDREHLNRKEYDVLDKEISDVNSDGGENWTEAEKLKMNNFLKKVKVDYTEISKNDQELINLCNFFKVTKAEVIRTIEYMDKDLNMGEYIPTSLDNKSAEVFANSFDELKELRDKMDDMDSSNSFWSSLTNIDDIRKVLEEDPEKVAKAKSLCDLVDRKIKEFYKHLSDANFTNKMNIPKSVLAKYGY